jgi:hypothetical protein
MEKVQEELVMHCRDAHQLQQVHQMFSLADEINRKWQQQI